MHNFEFCSPTKIVFGKDAERRTAELVRWAKGSRALLVYGGGSVERSGLLHRIDESLKAAGIATELFGGAKPNPTLAHARKGVQAAIDFRADIVLGIGGGSAIDTAKAVAAGAGNPGKDIWDDYWGVGKTPEAALPVGAVLTISAAGSETSDSAVLTNEDTMEKNGINCESNRPVFAVMNPELTYTLPKNQVSNGVADILMHTLERYFTSRLGNGLTDAFAEALMRNVIKFGPQLLQNPTDYDAASEIMWSGSVSHNHLTGLGGVRDFSAHRLGAPVSGVYDAAHGATLTALWGDWAHYVMAENPARFAELGRNVLMDTKEYASVEAAADAAIDGMVAFFEEIGMPTNFTALGIGILSEEELRNLADRATASGTQMIGNFCPIDREEAYQVYKAANR